MAKKNDDTPDLGEQIADIKKKKEMSFAMQIGKDGLVFITDLKSKSFEKLWKDGKKAGGSSKGAKGKVTIKGKIMTLHCDDLESVPGSLVKIAKKHFADNKKAMKIELAPLNAAAESSASDEEDAEAEEGAGARQTEEAEAPEQETVAAVEEATEEAVADQVEEAAAEGEDPDEALRGVLKQELDDLSDDLELAKQSTNAGAAKKVEALKEMFGKQIDGDVKKTASVMSLLKATVREAIDAGVAGGAAGQGGEGDAPAVDPAVAEARKSKMAELEKGVDALLAEFA